MSMDSDKQKVSELIICLILENMVASWLDKKVYSTWMQSQQLSFIKKQHSNLSTATFTFKAQNNACWFAH